MVGGTLDHPVDHPDDPRGPVWIRLDRRAIRREQAQIGLGPTRSTLSTRRRIRRLGVGIPRGAPNRSSQVIEQGKQQTLDSGLIIPAVMRVAVDAVKARRAGSDRCARA